MGKNKRHELRRQAGPIKNIAHETQRISVHDATKGVREAPSCNEDNAQRRC